MDFLDSCLEPSNPQLASNNKINDEDIFGSSVNLEESHINEGYKDGYKDGLNLGKQDGYDVGLKHGFESGEELGFYRGLIDVWTSVIRVEPSYFPARVQRSIQQMQKLLAKYPLLDHEDETKDDILKELRMNFKLYISESRNKDALESIERAAKCLHRARIINKFEDATYNRVGYTLVSKLPPKSSDVCPLKDATFAMVQSALTTIDFNLHSGSHPRLGVVDHICFHPLGHTSLEQAANIARSLAVDIGTKLEVPTFLYGAAHDEGRTLASIRRELGYFRPNAHGNIWAGGPNSEYLPLRPDEGPSQVDPSKGVVVVGSTRWVDNYNVPIFSSNITTVRKIAKLISERGGGLPSVQAMALAHGEGTIEVACNLLEPRKVGGDQVQVEVERLAQREGMIAGKGYFTDFSQEDIINTFLESGDSSDDHYSNDL